jgi:hypothetical protein
MLVINKKIMGMTLLTTLLVGCGNNQPKNAQIEEVIRKDLTAKGAEVKDVGGYKCKATQTEGTYICGADVKLVHQGKTMEHRFAVAFSTANGEWFQKSPTRGAAGDE